MFLLRLAKALTAHKVPYAVAGGFAVALHGALRGTVDVDLVIHLKAADFNGADAALKSLGLKPRLPVTAAEVFQFREEYMRNRNMLAWNFVNSDNPAEVVDILLGEDLARIRSVRMRIKGEDISVVSREDLIAMKRRSGRPQDLADVDALERLGGV